MMRDRERWAVRGWAPRAVVVAVLVMAASMVSGCEDGIRVERSVDLPATVVPGDPVAHAVGELLTMPPLRSVSFGADLTSGLSDFERSVLTEVNLAVITVEVLDGLDDDDDDLSWIHSLEVYAVSDRQDSTLEPVLVAWQDYFPKGEAAVGLEVDEGVDLLPYADEGLRIVSTAEAIAPPDDVEVGGEVTLSIRLW